MRFRPDASSLAGLIAAAVAAGVALVFHRLNYRGLGAEAMDLAQLARNIADGRGFATSFVRPVALPVTASRDFTPDLLHEPLYPLLLAVAMALFGARDAVVWGLSLALFVVCTGLLYTLVRRLTNNAVAASCTTVVFALSLPVLSVADSGNPLILSTCLLLALLLLLTPKPPPPVVTPEFVEDPFADDVAPAAQAAPSGPNEPNAADWEGPFSVAVPESGAQQDRRFLLAGAVAGLCFLTDYVSVAYVVPLAVGWGSQGSRWHRRTACAFGLGLVLLVLPWWIRNARLTGNPLYTLQWLDFSVRTARYPGHSLLRDYFEGKRLLVPLLAPDLKSVAMRIVAGARAYFEALPRVPHLYLIPLIVMAYWLPPTPQLNARTRQAILAGLCIYIPVLVVLGRQDALFLVPLAGLLAYVGGVTCQQLFETWMALWFEQREAEGALPRPIQVFRIEAAFVGTCGLLLLLPLLWQSLAAHHTATATGQETLQELGRALPEKQLVATDAPWAVAWYARRPALWLPSDLDQLAAIDKLRPIGAVYLSPTIRDYAMEEDMWLWQGIFRQGRDIPGFDATTRPRQQDVLYTKRPTLSEGEQAVKARPADPAALVALGRAQLAAGQASAALNTFMAAQRRNPKAVAAYQGLGLCYLAMRQPAKAVQPLGEALRVSPRDQRTLLLTAQVFLALGRPDRAMELYEEVLADAPEQALAINNLAFLYTQDNSHLYQAVEMARRAVAQDPADASNWDTLGWANYRAGRKQAALVALQRAVQLAPERGIIQYHLGRALLATGQRDAGQRALTAALKHPLPARQHKDALAAVSGHQ